MARGRQPLVADMLTGRLKVHTLLRCDPQLTPGQGYHLFISDVQKLLYILAMWVATTAHPPSTSNPNPSSHNLAEPHP